jgi:alkanesulfonate monooxygenase SsuD/methylene tetrahydromethanopterin reductase-like flavin-dependent oxidoreductase (luciferase family)
VRLPLEIYFRGHTVQILDNTHKILDMKFSWFHLMPWPDLPADFPEKHHSVWVDVDSKLYDPVRGHTVYHDYLDELEHADNVGFDGICVNEHHQNAYGLMPSPNLMAATLTRRTTKAKIVVMGNSVALYNPPTRVAEEFAMLDVLSGGRLIAGFPVGTAMDTTFGYGQVPATLRDKYYEGVDLILRAWDEDEPFSFNGEFTQLRYVNVWPRPIQKPHPPVWVPGSGSIETWEYCLRHDFLYSYLSFHGLQAGKANMDGYWETADRLGIERNPYRAGFLQLVAVAGSDAEAKELYSEAALYFYNRCLRIWPGFSLPPGYQTLPTVRRGVISAVVKGQSPVTDLTWEQIVEKGYVIAGTAETVAERLGEAVDTLHFGHLMTLCQFGNLGKEAVMENTSRFAADVAPKLRDKFSEWEDVSWPGSALDPLAQPAPVGS